MLTFTEIRDILRHFGLSAQGVSAFLDTSHEAEDTRLHYILDDRYVLKLASPGVIWEARLQELRRLIGRYRAIGVYCPDLLTAPDGTLSYRWARDGREFVCFVEEYARFPALGEDAPYSRREVVEHLGLLAAAYTGVDLSATWSMWSLFALSPLDAAAGVDEKQQNADALTAALRRNGLSALAERVEAQDRLLRAPLAAVFETLPRCVYQGDLNRSNLLYRDGHFAGLIDFNMAGTDVNINVFLNETSWVPEAAELDTLSVPELRARQTAEQDALLAVIFRHYALNEAERRALPLYRRIVELFQYPLVCRMEAWLDDASRRDKCAAWLEAMLTAPL